MSLDTYEYPSRRSAVLATRGMVATSQPLAAQAGLAVLQAGGNAVDAALATAIALTVVEPTSNGIGSDAFAIVWDGERLHGLNASGPAPRALSAEALRAAGLQAPFQHSGVLFEGKCMAILPLPDYPISGIRTGQTPPFRRRNRKEHRGWEVEIGSLRRPGSPTP